VISVIVPVYNEEKSLSENSPHFEKLSQKAELIFVDGGSVDKSYQIASGFGKVLSSEKGRASQMNFGARHATRDILLFLHVDAVVSEFIPGIIESEFKNKSLIGGCLTQRLDNNRFIFRLIEGFGNVRARLTKVFYGDQGIFVRKDVFLKMGGFPEAPIMEDIIFTRKLRRFGKVAVLPGKILSSSRRWEKAGIIKTVFLYSFLNILFWLGVPLVRIRRFYGDLR
jgi:rSAM/selenodomain-associated transferase 2